MNKIGIFDSGLGGLIVLKHIKELMPEYDYVFFGDQKHVPYGEKTVEELFSYAKEALAFLYEKENCKAVLLACNTTSSTIYERLREWVRENYEGRFVWGVVRPTIESIGATNSIVFFGTTRTTQSHAYKNFLADKNITVYEKALPKLASMIENGEATLPYLKEAVQDLPKEVETVSLVCTHYGIVLDDFKMLFPEAKNFICQENILPPYIKSYIESHEDFKSSLSRGGTLKFFVSASSPVFDKFLTGWFGDGAHTELWQ